MPVLRVVARLSSPIASRDVVHLDSLLVQAHPECRGDGRVTRADPAESIHYPPIPLGQVRIGTRWVYAASAWILPPVARRGRELFTSRKDAQDLEQRARPWTPATGPEKNYQIPLATVETPTVSWLCVGHRQGVRKLLRYVGHVGGWRRQGYGVVREWYVERVEEPVLSCFLDEQEGRARRHLPQPWTSWAEGHDEGACVPPYWHPGLAEPRVRTGLRCELREETREAVEDLR